MSDINNIHLSGNVGSVEVAKSGDNTFINYSLAVGGYNSKTKEKTTMWVNCLSINDKFAELVIHKGAKIVVEGRLSITEKDKKTYTKVIVSNIVSVAKGEKKEEAPKEEQVTSVDLDDDNTIPF